MLKGTMVTVRATNFNIKLSPTPSYIPDQAQYKSARKINHNSVFSHRQEIFEIS